MEMLQDPTGAMHSKTREDLTFYAQCIFEDIRESGDVKVWWVKNGLMYQGQFYKGFIYKMKRGGQHFWKRLGFFFDLTEDDDCMETA